MTIGDYLYQLTAKDEVSGPAIQRFSFLSSQAVAAVTLQAGFTVPLGYCLLLDEFTVLGQGGGAQTLNVLQVDLFADDSLNQRLHFFDAQTAAPIAAGGVSRTMSRTTRCILYPQEQFHALATFSAGAVANTLVASALGRLIPKANIQLR